MALLAALLCAGLAATSFAQSDSATATPPPASQAVTGGSNHDDLLWLLRNWHQEVAPGSAQSKLDASPDGRIDAHDLLLFQLSWMDYLTATPTPDETQFYSPTWTPTQSGTPTPTPIDDKLFYYSGGGRIYLTPSEVKIGIVFQEGLDRAEMDAFVQEHTELGRIMDEVSLSGGLVMVELSRPIPWAELSVHLQVWSAEQRVSFVTPVFSYPDGVDMLLTETFSVRFWEGVTDQQIDEFNRLHGVIIIESGRPSYRHGWYLLRPTIVKNGLTVLGLANLYYESDLTESSLPNFQRTNMLLMLGTGASKHDFSDRVGTKLQDRIASQFFYYSNGRKISLTPSLMKVGVGFKEGTTKWDRETFVREQLYMDGLLDHTAMSPGLFRVNLTRPMLWPQLETAIATWSEDRRVSFVTPVFECSDGVNLLLTDTFSVLFAPGVTDLEIEAWNVSHDVIVVESGRPRHRHGWFTLKPANSRNALEVLRLANLYYESELTECSVPNLQRTNLLLSTTPDDSLFSYQWHLHNTGQAPPEGTVDADIDAPEGWDLHTGSSDIIIAVIDSGLDLDHPDLNDHIWTNTGETPGNQVDDDNNGYVDDVHGWDFSASPEDGEPDDVFGHGTACAGLAAAEGNNSAGVAGVSWHSTIMAIRVFDSSGYWAGDADGAKAIYYAADNGAHVLSNSWGGGSESDLITYAIRYARNEGRAGKGCPVVFAAGNGGSVVYPGSLHEVIAVGATDEDDTRQSWSGAGNPLDVVAPSGDRVYDGEAHGNLATTDIQGSGGLNDSMDSNNDDLDNTDYTIRMGGTSGACPQVAGLAALILSQHPELTAAQVQSLIQTSAEDEIGTGDMAELIDRPGWDENYGWGRINVYKALATATAIATPGMGRFVLKDSDDHPVLGFDEFGFLYLTGSLKGTRLPTPYNTPVATPHPYKDEFILRNAAGTPVALAVSTDDPTPRWDFYIAGSLSTKGTPIPSPNGDDFVIRNPQGNPVVLITEQGDLYLKGDYYNGSRP